MPVLAAIGGCLLGLVLLVLIAPWFVVLLQKTAGRYVDWVFERYLD